MREGLCQDLCAPVSYPVALRSHDATSALLPSLVDPQIQALETRDASDELACLLGEVVAGQGQLHEGEAEECGQLVVLDAAVAESEAAEAGESAQGLQEARPGVAGAGR